MAYSVLIFILVALAIALFVLAGIVKKSNADLYKRWLELSHKVREINQSDSFMDTVAGNQLIQNIGGRFATKNQSKLFRMSGNPWGISYPAWVGIRFGGLFAGVLIGLVLLFVIPLVGLVLIALGVLCFVVPKKAYEDVIKKREFQYAKMYEVLWVLSNNLSYSDAATACRETKSYLASHPNIGNYLTELFGDLAENFDPEEISSAIKEKYNDYHIPMELAEILLTAYQTGEYPASELENLKEMLSNDMDGKVNSVLAQVANKATVISTPLLLMAMFILVIIPVIYNIVQML